MNHELLTYDIYGCLPAAYLLQIHILFRMMIDAYFSVGTLCGQVEGHHVHDKQAGSRCWRWNGNAMTSSASFSI